MCFIDQIDHKHQKGDVVDISDKVKTGCRTKKAAEMNILSAFKNNILCCSLANETKGSKKKKIPFLCE